MYLLPDLFRLDRMRLRRFERTDPGPHYGDGLVEVIPDDTTVASVEKERTALLPYHFRTACLSRESRFQPSAQVVLTVAENSDDAKVKIRMNDLSEVVGTDSRNYSEPVSRPEFINEISI